MIAIFVFESIYNWNESRDSFMKAYNEGIDKGSTIPQNNSVLNKLNNEFN
jgi:hypothetical protein